MQGIQNSEKNEELGAKRQAEEKENIILSCSLVQEIRDYFGPALYEIEVKDVRIGLAYTGVLLSENYGGVACTPLYEFSCCPALGFTDTLKGKDCG